MIAVINIVSGDSGLEALHAMAVIVKLVTCFLLGLMN